MLGARVSEYGLAFGRVQGMPGAMGPVSHVMEPGRSMSEKTEERLHAGFKVGDYVGDVHDGSAPMLSSSAAAVAPIVLVLVLENA